MTTKEIIDIFKGLPSGGYITADSRLRDGNILALVNACKNAAQKIVFEKEKYAPPQWFVPFYHEYEETWENTMCYKRFTMVDYVMLDGIVAGLGYIGSTRTNHTFVPVTSRTQLADYMNHPILRPRQNDTYVLIEATHIEVYGKPVKDLKIGIIPANPLDVPTFNYDTDPYPVDGGLLDVMKKIALNPDYNLITRTPYDKIQDGNDQTAVNK